MPNRRDVLRGLAAIAPLPFLSNEARAIPGDKYCRNRCSTNAGCPDHQHCDNYGVCVHDVDPCVRRKDGRVLLSCNREGKYLCCKGAKGGPFGHARGTNCRGIRSGN